MGVNRSVYLNRIEYKMVKKHTSLLLIHTNVYLHVSDVLRVILYLTSLQDMLIYLELQLSNKSRLRFLLCFRVTQVI